MTPPKYLDKSARDHWKQVMEFLADSGLTAADVDGLAVYCTLYSRWRKADQQVRVEGEVIEARNGYLQKNPWLVVANESEKAMQFYQDRFGLSPMARAKLKAPKPEVDDPLQEFLRNE